MIFFIAVILMNTLAFFLTITQGIHQCRYLNGTEISERDTHIWKTFLWVRKYIHKILFEALKFFVLVCEVVLYIFLIRILKSELHFYYSRNKYNLIVLLVASWVFFWMSIILFFTRFNDFDPDEVYYQGTWKINTYPLLEIILYMIIDLFSYFPMFVYVYFNIKNINFKLYVEKSLKGIEVYDHYSTISIFIRKSCCKSKTRLLSSHRSSQFLLKSPYSENLSSEEDEKDSSVLLDDYKQEYLSVRNMTGLTSQLGD